MIQKYTYGTPFETDAIVTSIPASKGTPAYGTISTENGFSFTYDMDDNDVVYGLGESSRGINKRGYVYESNCSDQPNHTEDKISLYGAHNFLVISGKQTFGLFVDYPGKLKFDIGYTLSSQLKITCEDADLYLYVIEGETPYDIVKQFRKSSEEAISRLNSHLVSVRAAGDIQLLTTSEKPLTDIVKTIFRSIWYTWISITWKTTKISQSIRKTFLTLRPMSMK